MANGLTTLSVGGVAQLLYQTGGTVPAPASPNYTPVAVLLDENQNPLLPAAAVIGDGAANPTTAAIDARLSAFNGSTWDRQRNNAPFTLLAPAGRTAVTSSPVQTNFNASGIMLIISVTAVSGSGGLEPVIYAFTDGSGSNNSQISTNLSSHITAIGNYAYEFHPGATGTPPGGSFGLIQRNAGSVPRYWGFTMQVDDASSYTYSIIGCYVR